MVPSAGEAGSLGELIESTFGSAEMMKLEFTSAAKSNFGSGWTWLLLTTEGTLEIVNTDDADSPVTWPDIQTPLLTVDVWEHAYYIDYRNGRGDYLEHIWQIINWDFVEEMYNSNIGDTRPGHLDDNHRHHEL